MRLQLRHLAVRKGRYLFRIGIPKHLQDQFGKREIKRVLPFNDLKPSAYFCNIYADKLKLLFTKLETSPMLPEPLEQLVREYYNEALAEAKAYYLAIAFPDAAAKQAEIKKIQDRKSEIEEHRKIKDWNIVGEVADAVIRDEEGNLKNNRSEDYLHIANELLEIHPRFCDQKINMINGDFSGTVDDIINKPLPSPVASPISSSEPLAGEPAILKDLYAEYREEKVMTKSWKDKTIVSEDGAFNLLSEDLGEDVDLRTISHKDMKRYRDDILRHYPSRRHITKKYNGKTLKEITSMKGVQTIGIRTINEQLTMLSSFFKWCARHQYISNNPGEGLLLKDNRRPDSLRSTYDKEDLIKIFTLRKHICLKGGAENDWVPVLALYLGARPGEICQMTTTDIQNIDGINCFVIQTEYDAEDKVKSVKTEAGHRIIPIHPVILELGFMEYVASIKKKRGKRLWPKLKKARNGKGTYGDTFSKRYGVFNRNHVTKDKKKVFYSLRHTFTDCLKQHGVSEVMIDELTGHVNASLSMSRYGKAYKPELLLEALLNLDFEIDVVKLLTGKPGRFKPEKKERAPVMSQSVTVLEEELSVAEDLHEFDELAKRSAPVVTKKKS